MTEVVKVGDLLGKSKKKVDDLGGSVGRTNPSKSPATVEKVGNSALVLLSSGHYSLASLFWALESFKTVETISFEFSERTYSEVQSSEHISNTLNIPHNIIFLRETDVGYLLDSVPSAYRNHYFLFNGLLYAMYKDFRNVIIGHSNIESEFYGTFSDYLGKGSNKHFKLHFPFKDKPREEVVEYISKEKNSQLYLEFAISCSEGRDGVPCQKCEKCLSRKSVFSAKGQEDPLIRRLKKLGRI